MNLGRAIKTMRIQAGLNQTELSEASGISVSYLSLLERNRRDASMGIIFNIARALNTPVFLLVFMASDDSEIDSIDDDLKGKLASAVLDSMH